MFVTSQVVYDVFALLVNDAVKVRIDGGIMEECEASVEVLLSDTMDQYRTFQMCERLLHHPAKLANQIIFQIPPDRQAMLIERCALLCALTLVLVKFQFIKLK